MLFWLTVLALTVAAVLIGFRPLFAPGRGATLDRAEDHEHDIAVYRHQLEELDAERERGAISPAEAQQARNEIARRILAVEDRMQAGDTDADRGPARRSGRAVLALFALVFVPGLAFIVYTGIGSPGYEAQPLAMRVEALRDAQAAASDARTQLRDLVARAEDHLRENPDDGRGWDVLAPVYFRLGDVGRAETAYRNAIRLMGETPARLSGLGEVLVTTAGGIVTEEASSLFDRALEADPADPRARFFDGLGAVQIGRYAQAEQIWTELAADPDANQAWRAVAGQSLARLADTAPQAETPGRPPALDDETIEQVGELDEGERGAMIEGMVASLDERLRAEPDDLEGWKRLIRARIVLDQPEALRDALERARAAFEDRPDALDDLRAFASGLGLDVEDYWR
ncbi:MAG: c-type cytochrome biogenesis protein CcmI [Roseitalea porphyridii]|jgi:cytochrome c-type biogenesis protein CcmH|uniref:c-type cytochrome biogenesis protein CcmI n=1 Tax=Roseitalea porphyridii TaxID=1852022 RepID=UPI0032EB103A